MTILWLAIYGVNNGSNQCLPMRTSRWMGQWTVECGAIAFCLEHCAKPRSAGSGCMLIHSFQQRKPTTVAVTELTMLDLNDAVFWPLAHCFLYPPPNDVYVHVICWYGIEARAIQRTMRESVRGGTRCVCYLILTDVLALMTLPFKIISLSRATDAG